MKAKNTEIAAGSDRCRAWWFYFACAALFALSTSPAAAHPIDEIAHLTAPPQTAEELGYRFKDCPLVEGTGKLDHSKLTASTTSMQWIKGKQFAWKDFVITGTSDTCILMLFPIEEPLTKSRAQVLMLLSLAVTEQGRDEPVPSSGGSPNPNFKFGEPADPVEPLPDPSARPKDSSDNHGFLRDDRRQVTTSIFPNITTAFINGPCSRGSGVLINPFTVLTAAHVVRHPTTGLPCAGTRVYPGVYWPVTDLNDPSRSSAATRINIARNYSFVISSYDYAGMTLENPFFFRADVYPRLVFDQEISGYFSINGYPSWVSPTADPHAQINSTAQHTLSPRVIPFGPPGVSIFDSGKVWRFHAHYFSGGMSGGPILFSGISNGFSVFDRLVGLSAAREPCPFGCPYEYGGYAKAVRFRSEIYPDILEWSQLSGGWVDVSVSSPASGATVNLGTTLTFGAIATPPAPTNSRSDATTGDLSARLDWTSNLDGPFGVGGNFAYRELTSGAHRIVAKVDFTDSAGRRFVGGMPVDIVVLGPTGRIINAGICLVEPGLGYCEGRAEYTTEGPYLGSEVPYLAVRESAQASAPGQQGSLTYRVTRTTGPPVKVELVSGNTSNVAIDTVLTSIYTPTGTVAANPQVCEVEPQVGFPTPPTCSVSVSWDQPRNAQNQGMIPNVTLFSRNPVTNQLVRLRNEDWGFGATDVALRAGETLEILLKLRDDPTSPTLASTLVHGVRFADQHESDAIARFADVMPAFPVIRNFHRPGDIDWIEIVEVHGQDVSYRATNSSPSSTAAPRLALFGYVDTIHPNETVTRAVTLIAQGMTDVSGAAYLMSRLPSAGTFEGFLLRIVEAQSQGCARPSLDFLSCSQFNYTLQHGATIVANCSGLDCTFSSVHPPGLRPGNVRWNFGHEGNISCPAFNVSSPRHPFDRNGEFLVRLYGFTNGQLQELAIKRITVNHSGPAPSPPADFARVASIIGWPNSYHKLVWRPSIGGVEYYRITADSNGQQIVQTTTSSTFSFPTPTQMSAGLFKIQACSAAGCSAMSEAVGF